MSARIISTVGRAIDVIVAGRVVSHLRFAAGVFVLAAGLLMASAGGAVAVADPDSSGSTANSPKKHGTDTKHDKKDGTDTMQQPSTAANSPKKHGTDTKHDKKDGTDTKQQPSTAANSPKKHGTDTKHDKKDGTDTRDDKKDSGVAPAVPDQVAPVAPAVPDQVAPVATAVAPVATAVAPVAPAVAPVATAVPDQVAPVATAVAPVAPAVAPVATAVPDQVAPVATAVAPVATAVAPVATAVPVPNLVAPVSDVIAPVQDMLTSVAGPVVPPTQLQSDLSSFTLGIAGVEPVGNGLGGIDGAGLSASAGASIFGAMSEAGRASSLPGMAPPAPNGAIPMGVRSFPRHALHDLPVAVSLAALAAVALPAVGGLVILTLAVVRVGYRQEKADFALRTAGLARFARRGAGQGAASRRRSNP